MTCSVLIRMQQLLNMRISPFQASHYLNAALEDGDLKVFLLAFRNVVQAHGGVSALADVSNKSRTSVYKALLDKRNPYLKSTKEILDVLGLHLVIAKSRSEKRAHL